MPDMTVPSPRRQPPGATGSLVVLRGYIEDATVWDDNVAVAVRL